MNPELYQIPAAFIGMGLVIGIGTAIDRLRRPAGSHRALPRAERVPATVAPETPAPSDPTEGSGWCEACTTTREGWHHAGGFTCRSGHTTPEVTL